VHKTSSIQNKLKNLEIILEYKPSTKRITKILRTAAKTTNRKRHLVQLLLDLGLKITDVCHGHTEPLVGPTEQLSMEVGEDTTLRLHN
jgi:hypothetical protein